MSDYQAPLDDLRFVMHRVLKLESFWQSLDGIAEVETDTADAILEEAAKIAEQVIAPLNREADEHGCGFDNGEVSAPPGFKAAYQTFCEGGWGGLGGNPDFDGMGMPKTLVCAVEEMVQGASVAFGLAPMLTSGAALAINAHGDDAMRALYLPKLYSGEWSGAMDLTEPHCGTDLGLIRTRAIPEADGSYRISGTKIFITWGEHDMAANIVHLVLAKLPDAPEGSRGISMFLVPKFLPTADGGLGERNALHCGSLEKKMGIKASATCVMNFDGAKGWLIGQPNRGLANMFTMMNYERLAVGLQGVGVAQASYVSALAYAKERLQGRSASGVKQPDKEADNLLVHGDVRRMLMTMKAWIEGSRAFYIYMARWLDLAKYGRDTATREHAEKMTALLTPVCKAFLTDVGFEAAVLGQQVLGGHGYIREWGQEQHVRDVRITQIYEGTNGVQAMDLIGRKTIATGGEYLALFEADVQAYLDECDGVAGCSAFTAPLVDALKQLRQSTDTVLTQAKVDPEAAGAAAADYLEMFGLVGLAYLWSRMATTVVIAADGSDFGRAKCATAAFYFARLLPKVHTLAARIASGSATLMALDESMF